MNDSQGHDDIETGTFWDEVWTLDDEWHPAPKTGGNQRQGGLAAGRTAIMTLDLRLQAAL